MEVQPDFRDLLALLNEHKFEYMIVGGYALAFNDHRPIFVILGDAPIFLACYHVMGTGYDAT